MLENHPPSAPDAPSAVVRRYSPPNRRHLSLPLIVSVGYSSNLLNFGSFAGTGPSAGANQEVHTVSPYSVLLASHYSV